MPKQENVNSLIKRLWQHVSALRRAQMTGLLLLMAVASVAEVMSIGAVLPFLGVLTAPEKIFTHPSVQPLIALLGIRSPTELLLPMTLAFGAASLLNGGMRLLLLWGSTRLCVLTGTDLSIDMYRRTLYQPYLLHLSRNSSEIINTISTKTSTTIHVIMMVMNLLSSAIIMVAILAALLLIDSKMALTAFSGFGLIYAVVIRLTRRSLLESSERVARETTQVIKSLQEGLGGIRDVLIDGSQAIYCEIYQRSDLRARLAQGNSSFIGGSPRYAVEALAMLLIAGLAYSMAREPGGVAKAVPVLGALALGAQRLLPIMQQAYSAWANIKSSQTSLADALGLLNQPLPTWVNNTAPTPLQFRHEIRLRDLGFRYGEHGPWVLQDVDLSIPRGSRLGFIGATGSGKSTLLDIIMGLLPPTHGQLQVDGQEIEEQNRRAWQAHIAHVPQTIFLADATVEENIAFGIPNRQIDHERVREAARRAQIADAIESWPNQYRTMVGERGVRLSGGQRQRIGIARALYKKADVIIFDEATSALDSETERAVMEAIEALDHTVTILIIAHRVTTLRGCDAIYELRNGCIARSGNYADILAQP
jgi:ATP-binding cassette, subfamily B, bacterial PglK